MLSINDPFKKQLEIKRQVEFNHLPVSVVFNNLSLA